MIRAPTAFRLRLHRPSAFLLGALSALVQPKSFARATVVGTKSTSTSTTTSTTDPDRSRISCTNLYSSLRRLIPLRRTKTRAMSTEAPPTSEYVPPKVWEYKPQDGKFGKLNKPTAGPQKEKELPKGKHAVQLHSLATPNGVKTTILLEELHDKYGLEYDAFLINIMEGDQFNSGFVKANPNSKIPALVHYTDPELKKEPRRVFESGSILMYLCEQFDKDHVFLPDYSHPDERAEVLSWVFWQMGSAPYLGGGFGHFYNYAPVKIEYAINRFTMETKRQLDVLERHLSGKEGTKFSGGPYILGNKFTIADIMIFPWYGGTVMGKLYNASEFLQVQKYPAVLKWANMLAERPAVKRGRMVNKVWGDESEMLKERHAASDFDKFSGEKEAETKESE